MFDHLFDQTEDGSIEGMHESWTIVSAVAATIGGVTTTLDAAKFEYAGPAPGFAGLDQVNVILSRSLAGRGDVDLILSVNGKTSNTIALNIR